MPRIPRPGDHAAPPSPTAATSRIAAMRSPRRSVHPQPDAVVRHHPAEAHGDHDGQDGERARRARASRSGSSSASRIGPSCRPISVNASTFSTKVADSQIGEGGHPQAGRHRAARSGRSSCPKTTIGDHRRTGRDAPRGARRRRWSRTAGSPTVGASTMPLDQPPHRPRQEPARRPRCRRGRARRSEPPPVTLKLPAATAPTASL